MAGQTPFSAQIDVRNDVANVALTGELDIATAPLLENRLAHLEGDGLKTIMLDLRDLSFLDSSGLETLVSARERAGRDGHQLVLIGPTSSARRLFGLTGTEFLLAEQDPAEALNQFTHGQSGSVIQPSQVSQPVWTDVDTHVV